MEDIKLIEDIEWEYEQYYAFSNPSWKCGIIDDDSDDDLEIPLIAIIRVADLTYFLSDDEMDDDDYPISLQLYTLPRIDFISKEFLKNCVSGLGISKEALRYGEIIEYGGGIVLTLDGITTKQKLTNIPKEDYKVSYNDIRLSENIDVCAFIKEFVKPRLDVIFMLIGFYFDKAWNLIGTTGWDSIYELVKNDDAINRTLKRWKKKNDLSE